MRLILLVLWSIPLLWLCSVHCAEKQPRQPPPVVHTSGPTKGWPHTVRGLGLTVDAAKENALVEARKAVIAYLEGQRPPMRSWQPQRSFVEKNLIAAGKAGEDVPLDNIVAKSWILTLREPDNDQFRRLDYETWAYEREMARRGRVESRMLLVGKATLGILALLVLLIGGIRVSEKFQTRYSRLVLAGMIGAGASLVVGLLLV